jgi:serine protease Do
METPQTPSFFARVRSHRLASAFTLLTILTVGMVTGSVLTTNVGATEQKHVDTSDATPIVIPNPVQLSNGFSTIVKKVGPAVVNIDTESIAKQAKTPGNFHNFPGGEQGGPPDQGNMQDFLNRFFGGQGGPGGQAGPGGGGQGFGQGLGGQDGEPATSQALGSGFIVDPRGYIITNNHVIDKADKIYVRLSTDPNDGFLQGRPAKVIGVDTETDIAVIKIETDKPLPTMKLGNSDGSQVGDWVLAIGSPFNLDQTVSAGIVSAKDRSIPDSGSRGQAKQFQRFLQTDAAINPGNSGGPLVDMSGQVIGMNTAIYTQSAGSEGVGFAMPSNVIAKVYNDLIGPQHKVIRGSIGIQFQASMNPAVSRVYGFSSGGVIVGSVVPSGGAAKAGIKPEDILVTIAGRPIKNGDDLVEDISSRAVGSSVEIGFLRGNKKMSANVTIEDRVEVYKAINGPGGDTSTPEGSDIGESKLGISVSPLPSSEAQKLKIPGGVIVTRVTPGSFADDISLGKGAVIVAINKLPITDEASYNAAVSRLKTGDDVVFVVRDPRGQGGNTFIGGTLR